AQIIQACLKIETYDNEQSLRQRVQAMEHQIYPHAVHLLASGRLIQRDDIALLDGHPLDPGGYQMKEHALELP
ncbi:MAG: phosphoribosylglycinamide formyltransferase, partial [Endozoicomonas sp.]